MAVAAVTTRVAGRLATASRPVLAAASGPVLRGADRVLRPVGRVLARASRTAGRAVLTVLPDGTVPALRTARDAVRGFLLGRVAPALRRVRDRLTDLWTGLVPAGVRRRMPRRRTLVIGVLAAALVAAGPIGMLATASKSATPSHAAKVADVDPGGPAGVKPGAPAPAPHPPAKPGKPGESDKSAKPTKPTEHASRGKHEGQHKRPAPPPAPPVPAGLSPAQVQNAKTIAQVAVKKGLPEHAVTVALATAFQESGLLNLNYGDRDSLGLFQQRPSTGWGTPGQIMNPHYSAARFFEALVQVPGWQSLPVTVAAQLVQRSAFPDAYAQWAALADSLARAVLPGALAGK